MRMGLKISSVIILFLVLFVANCLGAGNNTLLHTTIGKFDSVGLTSKVYLFGIKTSSGVDFFYLDEKSDRRHFDPATLNVGRSVKVVWQFGKSYDTPFTDDSKIIKSIRFLR
jgi:hypothetical protein